jgi:hypothetical protein
MATTALGLALQISASTAGLAKSVNDVNAKLDSMAEAGKKSAKDLAILKTIEISRALIDGVKAISSALTSAASSAADLFNNSRQVVAELKTMAAISNTSVENFQRLSLAAASVGIENDKLSDILKDVNDRVGDFLTTGGGPMADFFENIAPQVGVTADHFKDLSGPEALQLYVSSLEKAGANQQEMTFYLEAMASDLTALLPLLKDGGAGIEEFGSKADELGIVLTEDQVAAVKEMNGALSLVAHTMQGIINQVTAELAPIVTQVANEIVSMFQQMGGQNIASVITEALFTFADSFLSGLSVLVEVLGQIADGVLALLKDLGVVKASADEQELAAVREQATRRRMLPGGQFGGARQQVVFDPTEEQKARIAELEARIARREEMGTAGLLTSGLDAVRETLNETRDAFANPQAPQESVDATNGVQRAVEDGNSQVVEELQGLREDMQQPEPVALVG